jgi:flavodoxin
MKVLIVYYSTYGNVFKMARLVAEYLHRQAAEHARHTKKAPRGSGGLWVTQYGRITGPGE